MRRITDTDRFYGIELSTLPPFEKYDVAEFDVWLEALCSALRESVAGKWWEEASYDQLLAHMAERADEIRSKLISGEARLRPAPPPDKMPRFARQVTSCLEIPPPKAADTEAGKGMSYSPSFPRPQTFPKPVEVTVYCVGPTPRISGGDAGARRTSWPGQSSGQSPMDRGEGSSGTEVVPDGQAVSVLSDPPERRGAGAPKKMPAEIREEFGEVFDLERQGWTDQGIAGKLGIDEKTVQRRRARYGALHQRGEAAARP